MSTLFLKISCGKSIIFFTTNFLTSSGPVYNIPMSDLKELISTIPEDFLPEDFYNNYSVERVAEVASDYIVFLQNKIESMEADSELRNLGAT